MVVIYLLKLSKIKIIIFDLAIYRAENLWHLARATKVIKYNSPFIHG